MLHLCEWSTNRTALTLLQISWHHSIVTRTEISSCETCRHLPWKWFSASANYAAYCCVQRSQLQSHSSRCGCSISTLHSSALSWVLFTRWGSKSSPSPSMYWSAFTKPAPSSTFKSSCWYSFKYSESWKTSCSWLPTSPPLCEVDNETPVGVYLKL